MPKKPKSHSEREREKTKKATARAYDQNQRKRGPLKEAKDVRSSAQWQRLRRVQLNHEPLCQDPMRLHPRVDVAAKEVDHIVSLQEDIDKAWDPDNLCSLCVHCHGKKSAMERAKRGE